MTRHEWLSVTVALIAVLGGVAAAVLSAAATARRERAARRAERDACALTELAQAAIALRRVLRDHPEQHAAVDEAKALFEYRRVSVRLESVRDVAAHWSAGAGAVWFGGDPRTEPNHERERWAALMEAVGGGLRDLD